MVERQPAFDLPTASNGKSAVAEAGADANYAADDAMRVTQMIGHQCLPTIDGGMGADAARRGYAPSVNVVEGGRVLVD